MSYRSLPHYNVAYVYNKNWLDYFSPEIQKLQIRLTYPEFFYGSELNLAYTQAELKRRPSRKEKPSKIRDMIIARYKFAVSADDSYYASLSDYLYRLPRRYSLHVIAHGVEQAKGGLGTLLMICLSGEVRVSALSWGPLQDGPPNMSPLRHGPYYIIASTQRGVEKNLNTSKLLDMEHILVPYPENVKMLSEKLDALVEDKLLGLEACKAYKAKLIDYKKFADKLGVPHSIQPQLERGYQERARPVPRTMSCGAQGIP
jgi:hypothetical protein